MLRIYRWRTVGRQETWRCVCQEAKQVESWETPLDCDKWWTGFLNWKLCPLTGDSTHEVICIWQAVQLAGPYANHLVCHCSGIARDFPFAGAVPAQTTCESLDQQALPNLIPGMAVLFLYNELHFQSQLGLVAFQSLCHLLVTKLCHKQHRSWV